MCWHSGVALTLVRALQGQLCLEFILFICAHKEGKMKLKCVMPDRLLKDIYSTDLATVCQYGGIDSFLS